MESIREPAPLIGRILEEFSVDGVFGYLGLMVTDRGAPNALFRSDSGSWLFGGSELGPRLGEKALDSDANFWV